MAKCWIIIFSALEIDLPWPEDGLEVAALCAWKSSNS